jgi:hypothetical protein
VTSADNASGQDPASTSPRQAPVLLHGGHDEFPQPGRAGFDLGAAHETVNKVLTDFTQRGWIRVDGESVWITRIRTPSPPSALRCARRVVLSLNGYEHCSEAAAIGPAG